VYKNLEILAKNQIKYYRPKHTNRNNTFDGFITREKSLILIISQKKPPKLKNTENKDYKNRISAGHWWLMPGILATQEAETRSLKPAQANSSQDPISNNPSQK
jgi:hypothetical protein